MTGRGKRGVGSQLGAGKTRIYWSGIKGSPVRRILLDELKTEKSSV